MDCVLARSKRGKDLTMGRKGHTVYFSNTRSAKGGFGKESVLRTDQDVRVKRETALIEPMETNEG